jgi:hypothetical protein
MSDLDDRYDPDRWLASGKNLGDFLSGGPEAKKYYEAHPELGQRVAQWRHVMTDRYVKANRERNEQVTEEDLREIWRSIKTKLP